MRNKGILSILIGVAFLVIVCFTVTTTFRIRTVDTVFSTYGDGTALYELDETFSFVKGENLLFLSEARIKDAVKDSPYYQVKAVTRSFPNTVRIFVSERHAAYSLAFDGFWYVISDYGIVLEKRDAPLENTVPIAAADKTGNRFGFSAPTVGQALKLSDGLDSRYQNAWNVFLDVFEKANLCDYVVKAEINVSSVYSQLYLYTQTGVVILIQDYLENGKEKIDEVFTRYYENLDDSKIRSGVISVDKNLLPIWSDGDVA